MFALATCQLRGGAVVDAGVVELDTAATVIFAAAAADEEDDVVGAGARLELVLAVAAATPDVVLLLLAVDDVNDLVDEDAVDKDVVQDELLLLAIVDEDFMQELVADDVQDAVDSVEGHVFVHLVLVVV